MTHYELKPLPGEPIILGTLLDTFSYQDDVPTYLVELNDLLDAATKPTIYISDLSDAPSLSVDELIHAGNVTSRGANAVFHHPNLKMVLAITDSKLIQLGAKGLNSAPFGFIEVHAFGTLQEALDFARSQV